MAGWLAAGGHACGLALINISLFEYFRKSKFSLLVNDLSLEFSPLSFSPSNESRKFEDLGTKGLILNDRKFEL